MNRSGRFINTHPRRPPGLAASEEPRARSGRLFSLARFQAYVVFGLAYLRRVIFRAGSLLLAALLAIVRLFGSYRCIDDGETEQHEDNSSNGSHDDLLSMQRRPFGRGRWPTISSLNESREADGDVPLNRKLTSRNYLPTLAP